MPAIITDPHDGDDLTVASITTNVTDKIVAWESSHETGATTNGAVRHTSDQIDDAALPETTVPSSALQGSGLGVHSRLDMIAVVLSAVMATSGTGYAAKYSSLSGLTYASINAINTALTTGSSSAASASTYVKRASDGSAAFSGVLGVVAISGTGNWATTGNIGGVNGTFSGVIIAGSGARQITTTDGHLDATQLAGAIAASAMPALTGDVTNTAGSLVTTVSSVGGKTAAQVGSAVTSFLAASSTGVGNHGAIAKYDISGGMTFDAPVTAPSFVGPATAVAAGAVTAAGIANYAVTRQQVSDGSVVAQVSPNKTVQVAPYYYYNSANLFNTPPGTSPAIDASNALPSAGQQRFDLLYTDDSYTLGWLAGVPSSSSPTKPSLPVGSTARPLAWAGPITNATTAITAGMIFDARPSLTSGAGAAGGGGGGGLPVATPIVTVGLDPTATNETDIFALASGSAAGTVNGKDLTKFWANLFRLYSEDPATVASAPNIGSLLIASAGGMELHPRNYIQFSGNTVILNPSTIMFPNGKMKINLTQKLHVVSPPGGYSSWYIIGDCTSTTDGTYDIQVLSALPALTPTQRLLAIALNSGSAFVGDPWVGWEPMLDVTSTQMRPITESVAVNAAQTIGAAGVTTPATEVTAATKVIKFPRNMKLQMTGYVRIYAAASAYGQVQATVDGIPLGMPSTFGLGFSGNFDLTVPIGGNYGDSSDGLSLGPGAHTIRVMVQPYNNGNIVIAEFVTWNVTQWGV